MAVINRKGESSYRAKIQIQDSHFFKVVTLPSEQGLKIPDAFMRKYGCDLQEDVVLLKVPTGASWQVELVRNENHGTLLQKGWERFAEFYFIDKFYFLVFKYEGNSRFQVFIFNQTALEIEYPVNTNCDRSGGSDDADDEELEEENSATCLRTQASKGKGKRQREDDPSVEILLDDDDDDPPQRRPRTRSSKKKFMVTEKQKKNIAAKADDADSGKKKMPLKCSTSISRKCETIMDKEKYKSYKKAETFTSSNPFFVSFMQPSYVTKTVTLEIPAKFAKTYLSPKHERYILKRQVSGEGRMMSWPVIVSPKISRRARITGGWKKFVEDNGLKVGNVCVFELMAGTRKFNVTVY